LNDQKLLKKQLFNFIKSNLNVFIVLFILFGIFMYFLVSRITFDSVIIDLNTNAENIINRFKELEEVYSKYSYRKRAFR